MSASWFYHLFECQSDKLRLRLLNIDLAGVALMIAGSATSPLYYGFMCLPTWRYFWLGTVWSLCLASALLIAVPNGTSGQVKAITFTAAGVSSSPAVWQLCYYVDEKLLHGF